MAGKRQSAVDPGESRELLESRNMNGHHPDEIKNLVVFLRDRTGIHFSLEDAHLADCDSLLQLVIQEQGLSPEACDIFSMWLISPILELRLKGNHNPFQVVQQWDALCAKYTDASNDEIHDSEPVLMVQRDVFFRKEQEQFIQNEQILCLLYHEAKFNVVEGRYVLHEEDYHYLAGIQALIHLGPYNEQQHVLANYRADLIKFYPENMFAQSRFSFFSSPKATQTPCEVNFMEAHRRASDELQYIISDTSLAPLYRKYLELLWTYPFYGGAFFSGLVEAKISRLRRFILKNPDIKVKVCINCDGVTLFTQQKALVGPEFRFCGCLSRTFFNNPPVIKEILMYVPYSQLSWEFQDLEWDGDNDPPPTLMLQFVCDDEAELVAGEKVTKLLQIYSREAKLMDALIDSCVRRKIEMHKSNPGIDFIDAGVMEGAEKKLLSNLSHMSLETFTKDGEQLD